MSIARGTLYNFEGEDWYLAIPRDDRYLQKKKAPLVDIFLTSGFIIECEDEYYRCEAGDPIRQHFKKLGNDATGTKTTFVKIIPSTVTLYVIDGTGYLIAENNETLTGPPEQMRAWIRGFGFDVEESNGYKLKADDAIVDVFNLAVGATGTKIIFATR
jgi:hypothetical protein